MKRGTRMVHLLGGLRILAAIAWATLLMPAGLSRAEEPAKVMAPYLEETSIGLAWCDIERLQVQQVAKVSKALNFPVNGTAFSHAESVVDGLKKQGVIRIYCLLDLPSLIEGKPPVFVMKLKEGADAAVVQGAITALVAEANLSIVRDGDLLLVGPDTLLKKKLKHPAAKLARLQKQMDQANSTNAICIAPSESLAEALRMTMSLGTEEPNEFPFALRLLIAFSPMEGLRAKATDLQSGGNVTVDFKDASQAIRFVTELKTLLQEEFGENVEPMLPTIEEAAVRWDLDATDKINRFAAPFAGRVMMQAQSIESQNSLKQLSLAMHNHESAFGTLPPQALSSSDGKKLLSWRVMLLPFLDEQELYEKFKLDEPWDSNHNKALIAQMPKIFARPGADPTQGKTPFVGPLLKNSFFGRAGLPPKFQEFVDGTSNTIWILQCSPEYEVTWTKPEDWEVKSLEAIDTLRNAQGEIIVAMADGSVQTMSAKVASQMIMNMFTLDGGEVIMIE